MNPYMGLRDPAPRSPTASNCPGEDGGSNHWGTVGFRKASQPAASCPGDGRPGALVFPMLAREAAAPSETPPRVRRASRRVSLFAPFTKEVCIISLSEVDRTIYHSEVQSQPFVCSTPGGNGYHQKGRRPVASGGYWKLSSMMPLSMKSACWNRIHRSSGDTANPRGYMEAFTSRGRSTMRDTHLVAKLKKTTEDRDVSSCSR